MTFSNKIIIIAKLCILVDINVDALGGLTFLMCVLYTTFFKKLSIFDTENLEKMWNFL